MNKSMLKTGHVLETRSGKKYLVMLDSSLEADGFSDEYTKDVLIYLDGCGWSSLSDYNEDLNHRVDYLSIAKIYTIDKMNVLNGKIEDNLILSRSRFEVEIKNAD